jgi:hypothetical protein
MSFHRITPPAVYEHWESQLPAITPRSTLYQIRPIGIGMPATECLTSYLARLAHAHHLAVGDFIQRCLIPYWKARYADRERHWQGFLLVRMASANGVDAFAAELVEVVEQLTLTTGAQWTTLRAWREICSRLGLLRHFRAWCAACYAEQSDPLYDPLLWVVGVVQVCPRHGCLLTERCPNCQNRLRLIQHHYLPGFCSSCRAWLGAAHASAAAGMGDDARQTGGYELWAAEQIGQLIAAAPGLATTPVRQDVTTAIKACCDLLMEGNGRSLSHLLGVATTTGPSWCRGKSVPPLRILVRLSHLTRIPLPQLLTDAAGVRELLTTQLPQVSLEPRLPHRPPLRPGSPGLQQIQAKMEAAAQEFPPPSLEEMASRFGYKHASSLREKYPELSRRIVVNHQAYKKARSERPPASALRLGLTEQRKVLAQALRQPCPATLSALAVQMGYTPAAVQFLTRKSPELCRAILEKRRRYQEEQRGKRLRHCQTIIAAALTETPPPTLEEVAARAQVLVTFLRDNLAEDCRRLAERRACFRERELQKIAAYLQQSLTEEPPRSIPQLADALGVGTNHIRGNHPELCRLIIARHQAYQRACVEQKKMAFGNSRRKM